MFQKIIAFFMSIFMAIASFFGINTDKNPTNYTNISYGSDKNQVFDLYLPENSDTTDILIMIHGGSWAAGSKSEYTESAKWVRDTYNIATASVEYRFLTQGGDADGWDILNDISSAVNKIKSFASEKGITINNAAFYGHSAGAHLSLLYAYKYRDTSSIKPVAVIDYCGPSDLTNSAYFKQEWLRVTFTELCNQDVTENPDDATLKLLKELSPITYTDTAVPTLIIHGAKDSVVPYESSVDLHNTLDKSGIKNDFITLPNSGHDLSHKSDKELIDKANQMAIEYVETYLNVKK